MLLEHFTARLRSKARGLAAVLTLAVSACGGGSGDAGSGGGGVTPSPTPNDLAALPIDAKAAQPSDYVDSTSGARFVRGEVLASVRAGTPHETVVSRAAGAGMTVIGRIPEAHLYQLQTAAATREALEAELARVAAWPEVLHVSPNFESPVSAVSTLTPNDTSFGDNAWAFSLVGAGAAWKRIADEGKAARPVKVGVIDSGFQSIAGELQFSTLYTEAGEVSNALQPTAITATYDDFAAYFDQTLNYNHGMHVAGLIAARGNNGQSAVGMAWQANVDLSAARLGSSMSNLANFARMVRSGTRVVNLSFGATTVDAARAVAPMWGELIQSLALRQEFLAVFAAGNEGTSAYQQGLVGPLFDPTLPGYEGYAGARSRVLIVGALDGDGQPAPYSAHGPAVEIFAPGGGEFCRANPLQSAFTPVVYQQNATLLTDLFRTCRDSNHRSLRSLRYENGDLMLISGTSQAAPIVTGAAALLWSIHPTLNAAQLKAALLSGGKLDQIVDKVGVSHPKLRVDLALDAAAAAATVPQWDPRTWLLPSAPDSALILTSVICKFGEESRPMPSLPVEIYPLTAPNVNLATAQRQTDAVGFHAAEIAFTEVSRYQTDVFFFYVAPMEGRNPVINKAFRLPSGWTGPAVRALEITVQATTREGCSGSGNGFDSVSYAVLGLTLSDATPSGDSRLPADLLQRPAHPDCASLRSGTFRMVTPAADAAGLEQLIQVDAPSATFTEASGNRVAYTPTGGCTFSASGRRLTVAPSGVIVAAYADGLGVSRMALALPEQQASLADLDGDWNLSQFSEVNDPAAILRAFTMSTATLAGGRVVAAAGCTMLLPCVANPAPLPSFAVNGAGGFDIVQSGRPTLRAFLFRPGTGEPMLVTVRAGEIVVGSRVRLLAMPQLNESWQRMSVALNPQMIAGDGFSFGDFTISAVNVSTQTYTRRSVVDASQQDYRINHPRPGVIYRDLGGLYLQPLGGTGLIAYGVQTTVDNRASGSLGIAIEVGPLAAGGVGSIR